MRHWITLCEALSSSMATHVTPRVGDLALVMDRDGEQWHAIVVSVNTDTPFAQVVSGAQSRTRMINFNRMRTIGRWPNWSTVVMQAAIHMRGHTESEKLYRVRCKLLKMDGIDD